MKDYKAHGPQAWIFEHGDVAIAAIDALLKIDDERQKDKSLDIMPLMKDVAKLVDGAMIENAPYPSIFLCSRQSLCLGQIAATHTRRNLEGAREIIVNKRCRTDPNYSAAHRHALGLLYHLRIMKLVRKTHIYMSALNVNPANFETHILADSFAAKSLGGYKDENGKIKRDQFIKEHDAFRRHFNLIEARYESEDFKLENGQVTVPGSYPGIITESLIDEPIHKVIEHYLTNNNQAKVISIAATKDGTTFATNTRAACNLTAFEFA